MLLELKRLREGHAHLERAYGASAFDGGDEDYRVAGDVKLSLDVRKDGDEIRLSGRVRAALGLTCGRCLEAFESPVDAAFDLLYLPQARNTGVDEAEVQAEDLTTGFYADDRIDLGQLMREQFYLALPMKPLCDPGCRGLCAACGANLNRDSCACDAKWEDPRWAGLRALRGRDAG